MYSQQRGAYYILGSENDQYWLVVGAVLVRGRSSTGHLYQPVVVGMVTSTGCFLLFGRVVGRLPLVGWCDSILVEALTYIASPADQYRLMAPSSICIQKE